MRLSFVSVLIASLLAVPAVAGIPMDITLITLAKVVARDSNTLEANPYTIEACAEGIGLSGGSLSVPTSPTPTDIPLVFAGSGEYCVEQGFADAAALDAAFPDGTYTFTITGTGPTDTKSLLFNYSEPTGYLDFTAPLPDATNVPYADGLLYTWNIVEKPSGTGCALAGTCGAKINLDVIRLSDDSDVLDIVLPSTAVTFLGDQSLYQGLTQYESELAILNGPDPASDVTDLGDPVIVQVNYGDVNLIVYTTGQLPFDIEEIGVFKFVDRFDGTLISVPYGIEACVDGTGITSVSVVPPLGGSIPLVEDGSEWCADANFDTASELNAAFPNGSYAFSIVGTTGSDSKTINFQASEPVGYIDITNPLNQDTLSPSDDLDVTWDIVEKAGGAGCVVAQNCGDNIFLAIEDFTSGSDIVEELLPITATNFQVMSSLLLPDSFFDIEAEVIAGDLNFSDVTDMGDDIQSFGIWEDINQVTFATPEPGAMLLQLSALVSLVVLARRRR